MRKTMSARSEILLDTGINELEIIEFVLSNTDENGEHFSQSFGINVAKAREIIRICPLTVLPKMPFSVRGIFNLRGSIIPVIDLSMYLFKNAQEDDNRKMIISEFNRMKIAFIVDKIAGIHRISWKQINAPDMVENFDADNSSITGIIEIDNRNILLLDVEKIVADINPNFAIETHSSVKLEKQLIALTAEDSLITRKLITDRLLAAGFKIDSHRDGEEAWNKLLDIKHKVVAGAALEDFVNVVVTDIEMPQMDGYTLTKKIKEDNILRNIPVVIFSSIITEDILHKGQSVGADAQLTKPQIGFLIDKVNELINKNENTNSKS